MNSSVEMESEMKSKKITKEIKRLKRDKKITFLAHYYQRPEVQELADYVGDSLGLSQQARQCEAETILFAGVHFMAETAKIINPRSKVLLPDLNAGCSLAESCPPALFKEFISLHPNHQVVTYINCSAEIKAMSDIICTSSNAERIIRSIPDDQPIIFAPDKNLGRYLIKITGREMLLWDGACMVHEAFAIDKILKLHGQYPEAKIIAHPESEENVLRVATYIGSTAGMLSFVKKDPARQFIVATEAGILYTMKKQAPDKMLIPAPGYEDNTCACSECPYMKMNTIEKIYSCMLLEFPFIEIEESLRERALHPILRMLEISKN